MISPDPTPKGVSFTQLADWVDGLLPPERADEIEAAHASGDPTVVATVEWLRRFQLNAQSMPLHVPPPLVQQGLRQHFQRWSAAQAIMDPPRIVIRLNVMFDSRLDQPLNAVRGAASLHDTIHLAYRSDEADVVLAVQPLPSGNFRLDGQVMPLASSMSPVFEALVTGPGVSLRTVEGDDLGRFTLHDVPGSSDQLTVTNGELTMTSTLRLTLDDQGDGAG